MHSCLPIYAFSNEILEQESDFRNRGQFLSDSKEEVLVSRCGRAISTFVRLLVRIGLRGGVDGSFGDLGGSDHLLRKKDEQVEKIDTFAVAAVSVDRTDCRSGRSFTWLCHRVCSEESSVRQSKFNSSTSFPKSDISSASFVFSEDSNAIVRPTKGSRFIPISCFVMKFISNG
jgi:hypothetical protein